MKRICLLLVLLMLWIPLAIHAEGNTNVLTITNATMPQATATPAPEKVTLLVDMNS